MSKIPLNCKFWLKGMAKTNYRKNNINDEEREKPTPSKKSKSFIVDYSYSGNFGKTHGWEKWKSYPNLKAAQNALKSLKHNERYGYTYRLRPDN